jgi:hypothetical protein
VILELLFAKRKKIELLGFVIIGKGKLVFQIFLSKGLHNVIIIIKLDYTMIQVLYTGVCRFFKKWDTRGRTHVEQQKYVLKPINV